MRIQLSSSQLKLLHVFLVALVFVVSGCTTTATNQSEVGEVKVDDVVSKSTSANQNNVEIETVTSGSVSSEVNSSSVPSKRAAEFYPGTGRFTARPGASAVSDSTTGDITLMFQDAPIEEVAMTILGDLLGRAYVVDERVKMP